MEHEALDSGSHLGASGEHVLLSAAPMGHGRTHGSAGSNSGLLQQQHGNAAHATERLANIMQGLQQVSCALEQRRLLQQQQQQQ